MSRVGGRWARKQQFGDDAQFHRAPTDLPRQRPEMHGVMDARLSHALLRLFPKFAEAINACDEPTLLRMTTSNLVIKTLGTQVLTQKRGPQVIAQTVVNFKRQRGLR